MAYTPKWNTEAHQSIKLLSDKTAKNVLLFLLGYMNGANDYKVNGYIAFQEGLDYALIEYKEDIKQ